MYSAVNADPPVVGRSVEAEELAALRRQFDELKQLAAVVLDGGARKISEGLGEGSDALSAQVRRTPLLALGMAVVTGAIIATLLTEHRRPPGAKNWAAAWPPAGHSEMESPNVRARIADAAASARGTAAAIVPGLEQWAEALSKMDATTVGPILEKGTNWLRGLWSFVADTSGGR